MFKASATNGCCRQESFGKAQGWRMAVCSYCGLCFDSRFAECPFCLAEQLEWEKEILISRSIEPEKISNTLNEKDDL